MGVDNAVLLFAALDVSNCLDVPVSHVAWPAASHSAGCDHSGGSLEPHAQHAIRIKNLSKCVCSLMYPLSNKHTTCLFEAQSHLLGAFQPESGVLAGRG